MSFLYFILYNSVEFTCELDHRIFIRGRLCVVNERKTNAKTVTEPCDDMQVFF